MQVELLLVRFRARALTLFPLFVSIIVQYDDAISEETEGAVDGLSEKVSKMHA